MEDSSRAIIVGVSYYSEVYFEHLQEEDQYEIVGFAVDDEYHPGTDRHCGLPILGETDDFDTFREEDVEAVFAPIGHNQARIEILSAASRAGFETPSFIHSEAYVSPKVDIGAGVYVLHGTEIMPHVTLEPYVMISAGANICHHTTMKSGAFTSMGTTIGAKLTVGKRAFVGMGATVMTGVDRVGSDTMIGAGATVIDDVEDGATVAGVPAEKLDKKEN